MKSKFKSFIKNFKKYYEYLMTVNFKDLGINVIILICILLLSGFLAIPIAILQDFISSFIRVYFTFGGIAEAIFDWIFRLIEVIVAFMVFVHLFNIRFGNIEEFKKQVKEGSKNISINYKKDKNDEDSDSKLELPKTKERK